MTELEALNMLLRLIGSSPVNDITTPHPDVSNARTTLDRVRKQAQRRGWWYNIDYGTKLTPNASKEVIIPKELTSVVACNRNYIKRGNKLYNKDDNTFQFTETTVDIHRTIRLLDWDDMPDCVQYYCAYLAASEFVRDELEDPQKQLELQQSAGLQMLDIKKQDLEEGQYNVFQNARISRARGGVRPYARNNVGRFYGSPDT